MTVLPGLREHFRDILGSETVQPPLPRPRSGCLSASESASISRMSNFCSNRSLVGTSQPDDSTNTISHKLYHWLQYERNDGSYRTYQKYGKSSTHCERERRASPEVSVTGPLNHFHPSESSESSDTTFRDVRNDAIQTEIAESLLDFDLSGLKQ